MFMFHAAFALGLMALTSGVFLYAWSLQGRPGSGAGKFFGIIVIILSILSLLCTGFSGMKVWQMRRANPDMMWMGKPTTAVELTGDEIIVNEEGSKPADTTTQTQTKTTKKATQTHRKQ